MQLDKQGGFACGKSLQVDKRVITFMDSIIYAENISLITISKPPANMSFIGAIALFCLGSFMTGAGASSGSDGFKGFGILLLFSGIVWLILVLIINLSRSVYLVINLNSGASLYFYCSNREFLNRAVEVLIKCINEKQTETVTIQFDKCEISGGSFFNESTFKLGGEQ